MEGDEESKKQGHKHDSGAADLERVTDFVEEKELSAISDATVSTLAVSAKRAEREKIVITKEDVELMVTELEITKQLAERKLREHRGNVKDAMLDVLQFKL